MSLATNRILLSSLRPSAPAWSIHICIRRQTFFFIGIFARRGEKEKFLRPILIMSKSPKKWEKFAKIFVTVRQQRLGSRMKWNWKHCKGFKIGQNWVRKASHFLPPVKMARIIFFSSCQGHFIGLFWLRRANLPADKRDFLSFSVQERETTRREVLLLLPLNDAPTRFIQKARTQDRKARLPTQKAKKIWSLFLLLVWHCVGLVLFFVISWRALIALAHGLFGLFSR